VYRFVITCYFLRLVTGSVMCKIGVYKIAFFQFDLVLFWFCKNDGFGSAQFRIERLVCQQCPMPISNDPSFPHWQLISASCTRIFVYVVCIAVPYFSGAKNWDGKHHALFCSKSLESRDSNASLSLVTKFYGHCVHSLW